MGEVAMGFTFEPDKIFWKSLKKVVRNRDAFLKRHTLILKLGAHWPDLQGLRLRVRRTQ